MRTEHDVIGSVELDDSVYYGINTYRALNNFKISGIKEDNDHIKAIAMVKKAAAYGNHRAGKLSDEVYRAIDEACDLVISGKFNDQFVIDVYQAGAGTSFNMNANEVIANIALEKLGHKKGDYKTIHPNDTVNMSQSTNDIYPTMMRVAIMIKAPALLESMNQLIMSLNRKGEEFAKIYKTGRTHLQDAVRVTLGDEFRAWAYALAKDMKEIKNALDYILELNIGGTAVGNGANTPENYREYAVEALSNMLKVNFRTSGNMMGVMQFMSDFSRFMNSLANTAIDLSKISDDLRLLYSGPGAGIREILLPAVQQGSSIMPGKINPSIPEAMNMICNSVLGAQQAVNMSAKAGQLELNVFMPNIDYEISRSITILKNGMDMLREKAIDGIKPDLKHCKMHLQNSFGSAALLNPYLGYDTVATIVERALETGENIRDLVLQTGKITEEQYDKIFSFMNE